jgi:hypothetical protein
MRHSFVCVDERPDPNTCGGPALPCCIGIRSRDLGGPVEGCDPAIRSFAKLAGCIVRQIRHPVVGSAV